MIRRPPRSTLSSSSAASDVYKRQILDFVAFGFAAQSLIAPLGSVTLLCNVILAPLILGEEVLRSDWVAAGIIAAGCTLSLMFGDHETKTYDFDELIDLYDSTAVMVYLPACGITVAVFFLFNYVVERSATKQAWYERSQQPKPAAIGVNPLAQTDVMLEMGEVGLACAAPDRSQSSSGSDLEERALSPKSTVPKSGELPNPVSQEGKPAGHGVLVKGFLNGDEKRLHDAVTRYFGRHDPTETGVLHSEADVYQLALSLAVELGEEYPNMTDESAQSFGATVPLPATQASFEQLFAARFMLEPDTPAASPRLEVEELASRELTPQELLPYISSNVRTMHGFCYAAAGGLIGSCSVLFGKSVAELVKPGLTDGDGTAWGKLPTYLIITAMVCTLYVQMKGLNKGLEFHAAVFMVPVYQTFWIVGSIVGGLLYFQEISNMTTLGLAMFGIGVLICILGVFVLSYYRWDTEMKKFNKALGLDETTDATCTQDVTDDERTEMEDKLDSAPGTSDDGKEKDATSPTKQDGTPPAKVGGEKRKQTLFSKVHTQRKSKSGGMHVVGFMPTIVPRYSYDVEF
eukprot:TRINITY_DN17024_c0_g1_i3.p1 TRINITY_DN17024_c0_g1~~TRINITY_DN17024_c0_g1_i3.p1  ORF type:complete len:574 (+),score=145.16 TRINITY_DN17024_c0_g1_i3:95-1816(+)